MGTKKNVLFLCTGNSCRSQMAEGWARALHGDSYEFYSAGIEIHGLNPDAVKAMQECGVDISSQTSNHIDEFSDVTMDYVVSVCNHAAECCPVKLAQGRRVHHPFDDPPKLAQLEDDKEQAFSHYRRVCEDIRNYIEELPIRLSEGRPVKQKVSHQRRW